jgi:hypothetical protein
MKFDIFTSIYIFIFKTKVSKYPKIDIGVALPPTKDNNFAINA